MNKEWTEEEENTLREEERKVLRAREEEEERQFNEWARGQEVGEGESENEYLSRTFFVYPTVP